MCVCVCAAAALLGGYDANDGFVASSGQKTTQVRGKVTFGFEMIKKKKKKLNEKVWMLRYKEGRTARSGAKSAERTPK